MSLFGNLLRRIFGGGKAAGPTAPAARAPMPSSGRVIDERSEYTRLPQYLPRAPQQIESVKQGLTPVVSSWVAGFRFVPYAGEGASKGDLFVKFRSGVICKYQNIPHDLYDDFFAASSKGRFVHRYLFHHPYTIVGSVTE